MALRDRPVLGQIRREEDEEDEGFITEATRRAERGEGITPFAVTQTPPMLEFKRGGAKAERQIRGTLMGQLGAAQALLGFDEAAQKNVKRGQEFLETGQRIGPRVQTVNAINSVEDLADFIAGGAGEVTTQAAFQVGAAAAAAATGGVPGGIARVAGNVGLRRVGKKLAKEAAERRGRAAIGFAAGSQPQEAGGIFIETATDPEATGTLRQKALGAQVGGSLAAALDILPQMRIFDKIGLGRAARDEVSKSVVKELGTQALFESGTEATQEVIAKATNKFFNNNIELFDEEARNEYATAAALGAIGGGLIGGAPRTVSAAEQVTREQVVPQINNLASKFQEAVRARIEQGNVSTEPLRKTARRTVKKVSVKAQRQARNVRDRVEKETEGLSVQERIKNLREKINRVKDIPKNIREDVEKLEKAARVIFGTGVKVAADTMQAVDIPDVKDLTPKQRKALQAVSRPGESIEQTLRRLELAAEVSRAELSGEFREGEAAAQEAEIIQEEEAETRPEFTQERQASEQGFEITQPRAGVKIRRARGSKKFPLPFKKPTKKEQELGTATSFRESIKATDLKPVSFLKVVNDALDITPEQRSSDQLDLVGDINIENPQQRQEAIRNVARTLFKELRAKNRNVDQYRGMTPTQFLNTFETVTEDEGVALDRDVGDAFISRGDIKEVLDRGRKANPKSAFAPVTFEGSSLRIDPRALVGRILRRNPNMVFDRNNQKLSETDITAKAFAEGIAALVKEGTITGQLDEISDNTVIRVVTVGGKKRRITYGEIKTSDPVAQLRARVRAAAKTLGREKGVQLAKKLQPAKKAIEEQQRQRRTLTKAALDEHAANRKVRRIQTELDKAEAKIELMENPNLTAEEYLELGGPKEHARLKNIVYNFELSNKMQGREDNVGDPEIIQLERNGLIESGIYPDARSPGRNLAAILWEQHFNINKALDNLKALKERGADSPKLDVKITALELKLKSIGRALRDTNVHAYESLGHVQEAITDNTSLALSMDSELRGLINQLAETKHEGEKNKLIKRIQSYKRKVATRMPDGDFLKNPLRVGDVETTKGVGSAVAKGTGTRQIFSPTDLRRIKTLSKKEVLTTKERKELRRLKKQQSRAWSRELSKVPVIEKQDIADPKGFQKVVEEARRRKERVDFFNEVLQELGISEEIPLFSVDAGAYANQQRREFGEQIVRVQRYLLKTIGKKAKLRPTLEGGPAGHYVKAQNAVYIAYLSNMARHGKMHSVAFHESLHYAFYNFLTPEQKRILLNAYDNKKALDKLKKDIDNSDLFDDSQKSLIKGIISEDSATALEERSAYAYQLWAEGQHKASPSTNKVFQFIKDLLRDILGIISESEKADILYQALHDGDLLAAHQRGEPYKFPNQDKTALQRGTRNVEVILKNMGPMVSGYIVPVAQWGAHSNNPYVRRLISHLVTDPLATRREGPFGGKPFKTSYLEEKNIQARKWLRRWYDETGWATLDDQQREEAVKIINSKADEDIATQDRAVRGYIKKYRKLMDDLYAYMKTANVKVGYIERYNPVIWDVVKLADNKDTFMAMLNKPEYADAVKTFGGAENIYQALVNASGREVSMPEILGNIMAKNFEKSNIDPRLLNMLQNMSLKQIQERHEKLSAEIDIAEASGADQQRIDNMYETLHALEMYTTSVLESKSLPPGSRFVKSRLLSFLDNEDLSPYLNDDHGAIMQNYIESAARRAEFTRRFDRQGKLLHQFVEKAIENGLSPRDTELLLDTVEAVTGTLGAHISPRLRRAMSWAIAYQNLRLLSLSAITSMTDPVGILARSQDLGSFWKGIRAAQRQIAEDLFPRGEIKQIKNRIRTLSKKENLTAQERSELNNLKKRRSQIKTKMKRMAEDLGVLDSSVLHASLNNRFGSEFLYQKAEHVNNWFFKWNGLEYVTNISRVMATAAASDFIKTHAERARDGDTKSKKFLRELGLILSDVHLDQDGDVIVTKDGLVAAGVSPQQAGKIARDMSTAFNRFVDQSVPRPTAGDRPARLSSPYLMLVLHLKQFIFTFQSQIINRVLAEGTTGNLKPMMYLLSFIPAIMVADAFRHTMQYWWDDPEWDDEWTAGDHVWNAVNRSGLLGVHQFWVDAKENATKYNGTGVEELVGPTGEQFVDIFRSAVTRKPPLTVELKKAVPFQNLVKNWPIWDNGG